jgi:hypothetical protein
VTRSWSRTALARQWAKRLRQSHDRLLEALRGILEVCDEYLGEYEDSDFDAKAIAARIAIRRAEEAK